MSVTSVASVGGSYAYTPPVQSQQQVKTSQKAPVADTIVSISKQAQQLASDGDTQAKEVRESGAEKAGEQVRGKA
jgi:hypothetical protein